MTRSAVLKVGAPLHARPLDRFVRACRGYPCAVTLTYGDKRADGKNVVQLLLLAVPRGAEVTLACDGEEAERACEELTALLRQPAHGEGPSAPLTALGTPPWGSYMLGPLTLRGRPGAPGLGLGLIQRERTRGADSRPTGSAEEELGRLERAFEAARRATEALIVEDDPFCDIFQAQHTLLGDPALEASVRQQLEETGLSADGAVERAFGELELQFSELTSEFAAQRHADIADIRHRLLDALGLDSQADPGSGGGEQVVYLVHEARPSQLVMLDRSRVAAVISHRGGPTSHAAIVARGRGIPLIFASEALLEAVRDGERVLVNGTSGWLRRLGSENPAVDADLAALLPGAGMDEAERAFTHGPTRTADGTRVLLRANLGAPGDLAAALAMECEGCGLLRTELLFAGRMHAPSMSEQAGAYARIAAALRPHPLVIRLFDAGSDKPLPFLPGDPEEANPALGLRGVRLLLRHPEITARQLGAIAEAGRRAGTEVRPLLPMVVDPLDVERILELAPEGCRPGVMIETPASAVMAEELAEVAAFFSVGTNDLSQYVLAADRLGEGAEMGIHPALLRLVHRSAEAAREAGIECSVCGELAGDPRVAPLLLGLGVGSLSLPPPMVPALRAALARLSRARMAELAERALALGNAPALSELLAELEEEVNR